MKRGGGLTTASSAGSAVDLMEASFSEVLRLSMVSDRRRRRVHGASIDARPSAGYARAIDSRRTSEVHASMRSRAWRVAERGGVAPGEKGWRELSPRKTAQFISCLAILFRGYRGYSDGVDGAPSGIDVP
jgi:hypothetical protein